MPIEIELLDGNVVEFPDDYSQDQIDDTVFSYHKEQGLIDPSVFSILGAGVDSTQAQLANLPILAAERIGEAVDDPRGKELASDWGKYFEQVRTDNKAEAGKVQEALIEPQDALNAPGRFIKQQLAFQAPQMLGLLAATYNPFGAYTGPAAAYNYFTATNLDRQKEEGQEYNLTKAAGFASGQAASEALLMGALKAVPGSTFLPAFGKLAAVGIGGEVAQQIMERAAATLDLNDKDAVNEYIDSAIGAGVFVGVGGPSTYIATRNGKATQISDRLKERLANNEPVSPEMIVEEQIRDIPGTVQVPSMGDSPVEMPLQEAFENTENAEAQSDAILQGAGLDSSYFSDPFEKFKAASVVLKNTVDNETMDSKYQQLTEAGVDPVAVREYDKTNPNQFLDETTEETLSKIENVPLEQATERLAPIKEKTTNLQTEALTFANSLAVEDIDADPSDNNVVVEELDRLNEDQKFSNELVAKAPRKILASDFDQEIPTWLQKPAAEGVRRSLKIKQRDVRDTLANNIANEGYLEALNPATDKDLTQATQNEVLKGKKPSKVLKAADVVSTSNDLTKTINSFAQNEADLMNFKRANERTREYNQPQPPRAQPASVRPDTTILERVQPFSEKLDVKPEAVPFIERTIKTAIRSLGNRARSVATEASIGDRILADPIYKVQYTNFIDSIVNGSSNPSQGIEQFYYIFDHTGVLSAGEKRTLNSKFTPVYNTVYPYFGLDAPNKDTVVGPESRKELYANIYDQYTREGNKDVLNGLPQSIKDIIRKVDKFKTKMMSEVKRQKLLGTGQLFANLDESSDAVRESRLISMSDEAKANQAFKDIVDGAVLTQDEAFYNAMDMETNSGATKYNKAVGLWVGMKASLQSLATKYPVAAEVLRAIDFRDQMRAMRQSELRKINYQLLDLEDRIQPGFIQQISERIHRLEEQDGSYDLSEPGIVYMVDRNGNRTGKVTNESVYNGYQLIDNLKNASLDMEEQSYRAQLKYFGIKDSNISLEDIKRFISLAEGQNNLNKLTDSKQGREVQSRLESLKNLTKNLDVVSNLRTKAFFPRTRSGSLGLVVYNSNKEQVDFRQFNEDSKSLTRTPNKEEFQDIIDEIKSKYDDSFVVYGFDGKSYKPSQLDPKKVAPINLTRNAEMKRHNINSLVSAFDLLEDMGGLTKDAERVQRLRDTFEMRAQGNFTYFGDRKFIDGYEKDPFKALEMFSSRFANHTTTREYNSKLKSIDKALSKYSDGTQANPVIKTLRERMQYALDPQESLAFMKSFNYMFAMGGSPKSAVVQLLQLFTLSQGNADFLNYSPLRNKLMTAGALREAGKFISFAKGIPAIDIDNPNNVAKIFDQVNTKFLTKEQKTFLAKLTPTRHFESIQQKVFLEGTEAINKKLSRKGIVSKAVGGINKILSPLNTLTGSAESLGRLANVLLFTEMFTNDAKALARFEKQVGKQPKYKMFQEEYSKIGGDKAAIAALYMLDETFLVTGSTGKNRIATSGTMNLVSPFANFATQLMGALNRQALRDPKGFALGVLYVSMIGGVSGIPFYSNIKALLDTLFKLLGGGPMDLELEIREAVFNLTGDAKLAQAVTKGLPAAFGGVDLSGSANQELPVFNQALKLLTDPKLSEVISMPTSALSGVAKGVYDLGEAMYSDQVDFDAAQFVQDVIPYKLARDIGKAVQSAQGPVVTKQGQPLLPAQKDDPGYLLLTGMGFQPAKLTEARSRYWMEQMSSENPEMTSKRKQRNDLFTKFYNETDLQERERIKALIRKNTREAALVAREQGSDFDSNTYLRDGITKGKQVVTGKRDPKRIPKAKREKLKRIKEMFMVE